MLRSNEMGAGIAGKDFRIPEISGQRLRQPSHRRPLQLIGPNFGPVRKKTRWLLWLEDTSTDESRRAAAALRSTTAMLTN
jgi:hypothetical protein